MIEILAKALDALWQVALVALVLGAGLPALFALGVRTLNASRVPVGAGPDGPVSRATPAARLGAGACFVLSAAAALFGIVVIIWGRQLFS